MALTKYAVGGLQGCLISVTGVAFEERAKICSMVQELGGIYSPELKSECSHLVFEESGTFTGSSQFSQNQGLPIKVQYALKWEIPLVSKEWIYDCFVQRILLEESDYPALSNKFIEEESTAENLPVKINEIKEGTPNFLQGCHIYLNGESISSQRLAVLKRLVLAADGIRYTDLENDHLTHIVIHNQLLPNNLKTFLEQKQAAEFSQVKLVHDGWLFDSFKEGKRLSEDDYEVNKKPQISKDILPPQVHKWKSAFNPPNNGVNITSSNSSFLNANPNISFGNNTSLIGGDEFLAGTPNILERAAKILKGKTVYFLNGVKNNSKLALKARKAEMKIVENELEADWCVTGLMISNDLYKKLTIHRPPNELKNEIWFEAALDSKSHLPSSSFSQPWHSASFPMPQASKLIISQSGFLGAEREFYAEIIKLIGAQYTDNFSKNNTHLLIEEPRTGTKYDFAIKKNIECININWLKNFLSKAIDTRFVDENSPSHNNTMNNNRNTMNHNNNSMNNSDNTMNNTMDTNTYYTKSHSYNSFNSQLSKAKLSFQSVPENTNLNYKSIEESKSEHVKELFKGLVFVSSQRLWHRRDELSNLIESLGGIFLWSFDRTCTHYLHQGKLPDEAFKEFRQARQWDKLIVSPWWVIKCKESGKRVDESQYPHTYRETSADDTAKDIEVDTATSNQATNTNSQPQAIKNTQSQPQIVTSTHSQNSLDWNAIMAERKAQEFLLKPGSKAFNIEAHSAFIKPSGGFQPLELTVKQKYQIVFSGYTSTEKVELIQLTSKRSDLKLIKDDETVEWNQKKTILICNALNFTEKIFSACATGCWILKKEFLFDEFCSEGNFEKYELGPAWNANDREIMISKAPKYWRQRLATVGNAQDLRPFVGWKCALIVEPSRQTLYESVLRNGGAEIFKLPFSTDLVKEITHFFCANVNSIPVEIRKHLKNEQVFSTKHITNTIFRLND